jgi:protein arginine N-methyltransferase 5
MNDTIDQSRMCSVGLLTTDCYDDLGNFIIQADDAGHDFIVTPISHPTFRRVLNEEKTISEQDQRNWKDRPVFDRKDLVIKSAGKLESFKANTCVFRLKSLIQYIRMVW